MSDLLAGRSQMAMSLGFHIVFAAIAIAMPVMMAISEWRWLRTQDPVSLELAKRWARGAAILFAVGAVSGTVLSFELGLLWPSFMSWAGEIIGLMFALEGFAFFAEAIFLGVYIHGWDRVRPRAHFVAGCLVAISGVVSAIFVVTANAWMNTPTGFDVISGVAVNIDPVAAMRNPAAFGQCLHMILAAFASTGLTVAGIHSFLLLRDRRNLFHQRALEIALLVGGIPAMLLPFSGDLLTREVARHQPAKLAALEALMHTQEGAPLTIGGIPDPDGERMRYAIEVPNALSYLLYFDGHARVTGLDAFAPSERPPVGVVHLAFQVMVAAGVVMMAPPLWAAWRWWRRRPLAESTGLLRTMVFTAPLGFLAVEAGWVVTEVGRQPWIIYGLMRTSEALTPMPGLVLPLILFTVLYLFLAVVVVWLMVGHISASPAVSFNPDQGGEQAR